MLYYISLDIPNTSMFPCFAETKSPYLHVLFSTCLKWTRRILDLNCQVTFGCAICQRNYIGMSLCTFLSYFYPYLLSTMYIWTDFDLCWTDNLQIIVLSFAKLVLCQISFGASTWINCFFMSISVLEWSKIYLLFQKAKR